MRTGAPWRDLPEEFGNWNSIFRQFRRWADSGVWDRGETDCARSQCCAACVRKCAVFGRRHDETLRVLRWPASKKRQGTKSREVGRRLAASATGIDVSAEVDCGRDANATPPACRNA